jgi:hypothetical protein
MESGFAEDERHEIESAAQLSKTGLKKPQNVTVHSEGDTLPVVACIPPIP